LIRYTRGSLADIDQAITYLEERNPTAAERLRARISATGALIEKRLRIGRPGRVEGTRERIVGGTRYIVAYRVVGEDVEVLAVRHSSRRWPDHFGGD
jgi:plasmid stabilization system protein ParE